jgi:multiple sugar transport system substrate-binding protein
MRGAWHTVQRQVVVSLMAIAVLTVFGGCRRAESGRVEILFSLWGSQEQLRVEQQIIAAFEAEHPHIKVRAMAIGQRYPQKIQAMMVGNVAPDVIMVEMVQYDEWATRGALLDVTDAVAAAVGDRELLPLPQRAFGRDGRYYGLPVNCHGMVVYVNLEALAQAGVPLPGPNTTWEQYLALAPQLSRRGGNPAALTDYAFLMPPTEMIFQAYGVELFDDRYEPTAPAINTPEARAAFDLIRRMRHSAAVVPPDVNQEQSSFQLFRDGRIAFYFSGRWSTPQFAGHTQFDWDVIGPPRGPAGNRTMHGGTAIAVNSRSRHIEAATQFIQFYGSEQAERILIPAGRHVPVTRSGAYGEQFMGQRPPHSIHQFVATLEGDTASIFLYAPGSAEALRYYYSRVQQTLFTNADTDRVVLALEQDLNRWLRDNRAAGSPTRR